MSTEKGVSELQTIIDNLSYWCTRWAMRFNVEKCNILHYGLKNPNNKYKMNGVPLSAVEQEKDIGVIFDRNLNFDVHIDNIINKANRLLGIIFRSFTYMNARIFVTLYKAMVRSILEYANCIWSPLLKRQSVILENVQRRATRMLPELHSMSYDERLRYLKLPSLKYRRLRRGSNTTI